MKSPKGVTVYIYIYIYAIVIEVVNAQAMGILTVWVRPSKVRVFGETVRGTNFSIVSAKSDKNILYSMLLSSPL